MLDIKYIEAALTLCKDESKILGLTIGGQQITPGQYIPKKEAISEPKLSFNAASSTGTYIVLCLDIDPPSPSFRLLGPALHWLQPSLTLENNTTNLTANNTPFIADYAGPGPPPFSAPHRYVFLLYEQPENFDVAKFAPKAGKKVGIWPRVNYDLRRFEEKVGLGGVVAVNYFLSN